MEAASKRILKQLKKFSSKHTRDKTGLFIAEGERLVKSVPEDIVEYYVFSEEKAEYFAGRIDTKGFPVYTVGEDIFKEICDTVAPQGAACVCRRQRCSFEGLFLNKPEFIVVGEEIQDPGNLGTIIRTADAGGAGGLILTKGSADIYSPKVLRSAMGSVFNLPVFTGADISDVIKELKERDIFILAAHLKGRVTPYKADLKRPSAVLIGNEARGLSEEAAKGADLFVKLPIIGGAESLNASVACGILIYEAVRQRYGDDFFEDKGLLQEN
ncbi:MAG: RNA methyltransferase [Clostridiales bacterium]|nr:RNA methyltransferase [Clostridiales bacterium]